MPQIFWELHKNLNIEEELISTIQTTVAICFIDLSALYRYYSLWADAAPDLTGDWHVPYVDAIRFVAAWEGRAAPGRA